MSISCSSLFNSFDRVNKTISCRILTLFIPSNNIFLAYYLFAHLPRPLLFTEQSRLKMEIYRFVHFHCPDFPFGLPILTLFKTIPG